MIRTMSSIGDKFLDISIGLSAETISSLIVMGIIVILCLIIAILAKRADPLKKPKGLLFLAETGVKFFDGIVVSLMGNRYKGFGGFMMALAVYLFISFIWGLTGLPSPVTNLATPLSLGLIAFVAIHANSVRFTKWRYFKRYVEPVPLFLPINLISMWAPLLSLSMRLFGNALAGWTLMTLIYSAFEGMLGTISLAVSPFITPILHAYFDLFSALIQTAVFMFLTMIFVANEGPEDDEIDELSREGGK